MQYINEIRNKVEVAYDQARGTELEKKVKAATSPENWAATNTQKQELARATLNYDGYREIMPLVWERLQQSSKKNWQVTFKSLDLLETFIRFGSDRVIDECRERLYQIRSLQDFQVQDERGNERGSGIRACAKRIVDLMNDREALEKVRKESSKNREKFTAMGSGGGNYGGGGSSDWGNSGGGGSDWGNGSSSYDTDVPRRASIETPAEDEDVPKKKKKKDKTDGEKGEKKKKKKPKDDDDDDPFDKPADEDDDDDDAEKKKKEKKAKKKEKSAKAAVDSDQDSNKGDEDGEDGEKKKKKKKKLVVKMRDPASTKAAAPVKLAAPAHDPISVGEPITSNGGADDEFTAFSSSTPAAAAKASEVTDLFSQIGLDSGNKPKTAAPAPAAAASFGGFDDFDPRGSFAKPAAASSSSFDAFSNFSSSTAAAPASNAFFASATPASSQPSFDIFGSAPPTASKSNAQPFDIFAAAGNTSTQQDDFGGFASATPTTSQSRPTSTAPASRATPASTTPSSTGPKDAWDINGLVNLGNINSTPAQVAAARPAINAGKPSMSQLKGDTFTSSGDSFAGLGFAGNAPLQQPGGMGMGGMGMGMGGGYGQQQQRQQPAYQPQGMGGMGGMGMGGIGGMGGMGQPGFGGPQGGMGGMGMGGGFGQPAASNNAFAGLGSFPTAAKPKTAADINNVFF